MSFLYMVSIYAFLKKDKKKKKTLDRRLFEYLSFCGRARDLEGFQSRKQKTEGRSCTPGNDMHYGSGK